MKLLKVISAIAAIIIGLAAPARADDEAESIKHLMMSTFDKPGTPLTVEPVTVYRDVAVAGWAQGETGGRALLRKKQGKWILTLCSGDALKEAKSLRHFGFDSGQAASE